MSLGQLMKTNLVLYGTFPYKLFCVMLALRLVDLFLIQSSYVPDEYWQTLEVAHRKVFGYGHLTWEWTTGVRSYFYVTIVGAYYWLLKYLNIDTVQLVILGPRLIQAVFSAVADVYFVRWVHDKRSGQYSWAFITWVTSYFISYCSTRTLINTLEMNLTTIALYYYPWTPRTKSFTFAFLTSLLFFIRPTSAVIWFPLITINVLSAKNPILHILKSYLPVSLLVGFLSVSLDSYFHGQLIITPWEFFVSNVLNNVGEFYGVHSYLWFFYAGIPAVLGLQLLPFLYSSFNLLSNFSKVRSKILYDVEYQMFATIVWSVTVFSLVPHKEFRFLLPLLPMMLYLSSGVMSKWSVRAKLSHIYVVAFSLIITNFSAVLFLGQFHKVGTLETMRYLSQVGSNDTASKFLFLTPCHSLPLYSHLHVNVSTRFLTCEPNLDNAPYYVDEAEEFYNNTIPWLRREYGTKVPCTLPTHIIAYNSLNITNFLHNNNYFLSKSTFDAYIYPDRLGDKINVYKRRGKTC